MGLFLIFGQWLKIQPKKSKGQLNVCTVTTVYGVLFPPEAEICATLAGNFCQ
jgi:hypothetical protein